MNKTIIKYSFIIGVFLSITSCAVFQTSMTPNQVYNILPTLTKSKFITQAQAEKAIQTGKCKYLVKGRTYTAPMGLTVKGDLKNGAEGIDQWVTLDKGNAYILKSYKWVNVDDAGSTQLSLEFDTVLCE